MTTVTISIPESLKEYIDREVSLGGYGTIGNYISALVLQSQKRSSNERIDELLLEGLHSEAHEMTDGDWEDIHRRLHDRHTQRVQR